MGWREFAWSSIATARLTGLLLLRRQKIFFLGLLVLLPAILPVVVAALRTPWSPRGSSGLDLYALIAEYGFLITLVPLGAILTGTALMGDELETGTATYLLTRPAPRSSLVAGKLLAYAVVMTATFLPSLALTFASVVLTSTERVDLATGLSLLARTGLVICVAIGAYGALCCLLGTLTQRPVIYAAVFVFGWEPLTRIVPGYVDHLTLRKHLLALWPTLTLGDRIGGAEISRKVIEVGVVQALVVLAITTAAFGAATTLTLRWKEFVRGQTLG